MRPLHKLILGLTTASLSLAAPNCSSAEKPEPDLEETVQEITINGTVIDVKDLPFGINTGNSKCNASYTSLTKVSIREIMSSQGKLKLLYIHPPSEDEPAIPYERRRVHLVYRPGQEISTDEILERAGVKEEVLNLAVANRYSRGTEEPVNFYVPPEHRTNRTAPSKEQARANCERAFLEDIHTYGVDGTITEVISSEQREKQYEPNPDLTL